ncbi:MAG: ParB/RepB/Spo0J family partition protein [Patescibacteria group bacterium]|nr:ParB/RepB/Spo0J family partition protein [Patescibacteria group bacterium]MDE1944206.1 ParB/RepB/Spo0J family partition protein [Patescibacteria group bacterium]MDE1944921.1 ParB/RepB/Spo0J family partition protein [Patescibacteria group bacterium]MDE2057442.1 ParB/RepB/Spo0J family partition protein [Patescibacteria group bacterium]
MNEEAKYVPTKYDSIFWIETDKIEPNPYQPRRDFTEEGLRSLAESIRQYGLLQPLTVTRSDVERPDGGLEARYELISGERRLRASKLIGLKQVPVVIRHGENNLTKLELAIIENLQREDLNAIDRAKALARLIEEFGVSQTEAAAKIGKSREYVSNSLRLLALPEGMQEGLVNKEINEGHARALLMLADRPEEQETLFHEIVLKKLPTRAAERIARSIAQDRVRKNYYRKTPDVIALEKALAEALGTRVIIESGGEGGRLTIDFFSKEDLAALADALSTRPASPPAPAEPPVFPNTTPVDSAEPAPEPADEGLYAVSDFSI